MKNAWLPLATLAAAIFFVGCETVPEGVERGPHGTIAYDVLVEASEPGARIEANGESIGNTPLHLRIYGDKDGTFHDFGSYHYVIRALPLTTNQHPQTKIFQTGKMFTPEDRIPQRIYFDMTQPQAVYPPPGPPVYVYPAPPVYYYPPPYYYGPSFRFHFGPRPFYHHHHHHRFHRR